MEYSTSIIEVKGVGDKTKALFRKLNIETVGDLLEHYPRDYDVFEKPVAISQVKNGVNAIYACVRSVISEKKIRKLNILSFSAADQSGQIQITFFNMPFLKKTLKPGQFYVFRGNIQKKGSIISMDQPKIYSKEDYDKFCHILQPRYSLTKGLTNLTIQKTVKKILEDFAFDEEYYPDDLIKKYDLIGEREAYLQLHFPNTPDSLQRARKRLVFDEFFTFLYLLRKNRSINQGLTNQYQMFETADTVRFLEQLPFPLTRAQRIVWQEIREDISSTHCMNRLIQGDVGSGKTIIAVLALIMTVANGYQGAMMAPTEVLATQHYETFLEYKEKYHLNISPILLVGSMTVREKKAAYEKIAKKEANIVIGTHAIIQDKVQFQDLALVVTDEQHRFGVNQRETLSAKGKNPHILVMSATPIPRTLAIILYGDLDISVIDELPTGRLPIKNCVVNTSYRPKAYKFIEEQVKSGRQVYVICPQVEPGEIEELENVVEYCEKLKAVLAEEIQVAYLHGKMKASEKKRIMDDFSMKNIDVLVSTTVIEVGINVPNATVMMVENAERFGLAQLHQLRGRVGRGEFQSYCIFVSSQDNDDTMKRLQILNRSNDGFFIASEDLKLRGPGDLFGIRQSGEFLFKLGDIYTDAKVLKDAAQATEYIMNKDENLILPEHVKLRHHLQNSERNTVDFRTI